MYERIMSLWNQGKTSKEIESILGLPESDVLGYVRKGRWYKPKGKKVSETPQKVQTEPESSEIQKAVFLEPKVSNQESKKLFFHKKFVELWKLNVKTDKMAEILGTTSGSVRNYAARHRDECPSRTNRYLK